MNFDVLINPNFCDYQKNSVDMKHECKSQSLLLQCVNKKEIKGGRLRRRKRVTETHYGSENQSKKNELAGDGDRTQGHRIRFWAKKFKMGWPHIEIEPMTFR